MIDSHCHIHMVDYALDATRELEAAKKKGVENVIVIGEGSDDSQRALEFAIENNAYAAIGLHPHNADLGETELNKVLSLANHDRIIAIGECGLDYFYLNSSKQGQKKILRFHLEAMINHGLPGVFHVRGSKEKPYDAFADFFKILADFPKTGGVVHSFSATEKELAMIIGRDLSVGVNGIATFTKNAEQLSALSKIPIEKLLLETDSPFLSPAKYRGKTNSPRYLNEIAKFLAKHRNEPVAELREHTRKNTKKLFAI